MSGYCIGAIGKKDVGVRITINYYKKLPSYRACFDTWPAVVVVLYIIIVLTVLVSGDDCCVISSPLFIASINSIDGKKADKGVRIILLP